MKELMKLNQIIYNIIKAQIDFGTYHFEDHLPPIEEMADILMVSVDTVRLAYHQLQEDGYITLSKRIGSAVKVQYSREEIENHIQVYFAERKELLSDLCASMPLLLSGIQISAWKLILKKDINEIETFVSQPHSKPVFWLMFYLHMIYGALKNDLLTNLFRKLSSIYMLPFLSLEDYDKYVYRECNSIPEQIRLSQQEDWTALRSVILDTFEGHLVNITNFYETRITFTGAKKQLDFTWNSYNNASQVCYFVGFEILQSIILGSYPEGSLLPSLKSLAEEKQVSVSTIRHTLALLNDLGIVKTINGVGTKVLSIVQAAGNLNTSNPTMRKRLLGCKQSLQLIALSCHDIAMFTIRTLDETQKKQWIEELYSLDRLKKYDLVSSASIRCISQFIPYQTIRIVYAELYKQLFWGTPLRGLLGPQEAINAYYHPYYHILIDALKNNDAKVFAENLEEIFKYKFEHITQQLNTLGIQE